ncbi:MAG: pyridoxamine 5'-phosphate oxidase family protein [Frankiaceae bacterium]
MEAPSGRTRVRREPEHGVYDRAVIDAVLDEGLVAHLGVVGDGGQPYVLPVGYGRAGDGVLVHGSSASRLFRLAAEGAPACLTVTLLDGVVLARSTFSSTMNYRSVVVLGEAVAITGEDEKLAALRTLSERLAPGHFDYSRPPTAQELKATTVLRLPLTESSAKVRVGPPHDDADDQALPLWAGVVPLTLVAGAPEPDPAVPAGHEVPPHVREWAQRRSRS